MTSNNQNTTEQPQDQPLFKVGDRVRVVHHHVNGTHHDAEEALKWTGAIGTEGNIFRITDGETKNLYLFSTDTDKVFVAFANEIEAVNPQDRKFPPATDPTVIQELRAALAALQARVATLEAVARRPRVAPFDPNDPDDVMMVEMTAAFEAHGPLTFTAVETPAAKAVAPKLTPAKLRISRQMRHALEVYAEPQYIVDGLTIETVDGHYVGMMDRRIQQSMCKRGFVADSSEITHKRTFAITDLGRAALESAK